MSKFDQLQEVPVYKYSIEESKSPDTLYQKIRNMYSRNHAMVKLVSMEENTEVTYSQKLLEKFDFTYTGTYLEAVKCKGKRVPGLFTPFVTESAYVTMKQYLQKFDFMNVFPKKQKYSWNDVQEAIKKGDLGIKTPAPYIIDNVVPGFVETICYKNVLDISKAQGILGDCQFKAPITGEVFYVAQPLTFFGCHTEPMHATSYNLMFWGEKAWLTVAPEYFDRVQSLLSEIFNNEYTCPGFNHHTTGFMFPEYLTSRGIPVMKTIQREKEIVLIFPKGLHWGANLQASFNMAVAAGDVSTWLPEAFRSKSCLLDCPRYREQFYFDLKPYFQQFCPEKLKAYENGDDPWSISSLKDQKIDRLESLVENLLHNSDLDRQKFSDLLKETMVLRTELDQGRIAQQQILQLTLENEKLKTANASLMKELDSKTSAGTPSIKDATLVVMDDENEVEDYENPGYVSNKRKRSNKSLRDVDIPNRPVVKKTKSDEVQEWKCTQCQKVFSWGKIGFKKAIKNHEVTHLEPTVSCMDSKCILLFKDIKRMKDHHKRYH